MEMMKDIQNLTQNLADIDDKLPSGESLKDVMERLSPFLGKL